MRPLRRSNGTAFRMAAATLAWFAVVSCAAPTPSGYAFEGADPAALLDACRAKIVQRFDPNLVSVKPDARQIETRWSDRPRRANAADPPRREQLVVELTPQANGQTVLAVHVNVQELEITRSSPQGQWIEATPDESARNLEEFVKDELRDAIVAAVPGAKRVAE